MSKEGLQKVIQQGQIDDSKSQVNALSTEDLRDLFTLRDNTRSEIHENMECERCEIDGSGTSVDSKNLGSDSAEIIIADGHENSDIGDFAKISGCLLKQRHSEKQIGTPLEEDLKSWAHHNFPATVPDLILQAAAGDEVTFVFTNQVEGKLAPIESAERSLQGQKEQIGKRYMQIEKFPDKKNRQRHEPTGVSQQRVNKRAITEKESSVEFTEIRCRDIKPIDKRLNLQRISNQMSKSSNGFHMELKSSRPTIFDAAQRTQLPMKRMFSDANNPDDDFA
eukprot:Gb_13098 [translate_table: standard]